MSNSGCEERGTGRIDYDLPVHKEVGRYRVPKVARCYGNKKSNS